MVIDETNWHVVSLRPTSSPSPSSPSLTLVSMFILLLSMSMSLSFSSKLMEMDLKDAMKRTGKEPFTQSELKGMLHQILAGMDHVHSKWLLHRDMKTSNILVHRSGRIAICDFGLARKYQHPLKALTQMVITLWYRPPELLFGETVYGPAVDMWR